MWDNQQETNWFSGILEAEGNCQKTHENGGQTIRVSNTDMSIVDACKRFLESKYVTYTEDVRNATTNRKRLVTLRVHDCYTLIKHLGDSFQCRRREFMEKLEFGSSTTTRDAPLVPDLHWLVGIFEGEGCVGLRQDRNSYTPDIRMVNTNDRILSKFVATLHAEKLSWHVNEHKSSGKPATCIRVGGLLRCRQFLTRVGDKWRSRIYAKRAEKLLEFINSRLSVGERSQYSETEV